jgi:hypothetical protein
MRKLVEQAFVKTVESLSVEFEKMPLHGWCEAVFRFQFCCSVAQDHPEVDRLVECDRIDLVLRNPPEIAFIEFKFYGKPPKSDPYTGKRVGFKGGPGRKNFSEFQKCIDTLAGRRSVPGLSKYVVLFYADPNGAKHGGCSFSQYYDHFEHPKAKLVSERSVSSDDYRVRCQLYEVFSDGFRSGTTAE